MMLFCIGLNDNPTKNYLYCAFSIIITVHILAINVLSGLRPGGYRGFFLLAFELYDLKCYVILTVHILPR